VPPGAGRRGEVVITKRGKAVAKIVPLTEADRTYPLEGLIAYQGDVVSPLDVEWDAAK
jgi:antitoxin (DNA-binding transcriptional repressor) of toxin-antitoxin stability system